MSQTDQRTMLDRLMDPVSRCLTTEAAERLVALRADAGFQQRLDTLADRCTEGLLSTEERGEYETYVQFIEFISILQAKARAMLAARSAGRYHDHGVGLP